jgi:hypothetical protein
VIILSSQAMFLCCNAKRNCPRDSGTERVKCSFLNDFDAADKIDRELAPAFSLAGRASNKAHVSIRSRFRLPD